MLGARPELFDYSGAYWSSYFKGLVKSILGRGSITSSSAFSSLVVATGAPLGSFAGAFGGGAFALGSFPPAAAAMTGV